MTKRRTSPRVQQPQPTAGELYRMYRGNWARDKLGRLVLDVPGNLRFAAQRHRGATCGLAALEALTAAFKCKVTRDALVVQRNAIKPDQPNGATLAAQIETELRTVEGEYSAHIKEYEILKGELER